MPTAYEIFCKAQPKKAAQMFNAQQQTVPVSTPAPEPQEEQPVPANTTVEERIENLASQMAGTPAQVAQVKLAVAGEYIQGGEEALEKLEAGLPQPAPVKTAQEIKEEVVEDLRQSEDILGTGVLVYFSCPIPGNSKVDRKTTETVKNTQHMGKQSGSWNKTKFPPAAYARVDSVAAAARKYHYANTWPWQIPGQQFLPMANRSEYLKGMAEWERTIRKAREDFIAAIPEMKEWAKREHNGSYDESLYNEEDIRAGFGWEIITMPVPSKSHFVGKLRAALGADADKIDAMVQQAMKEGENALWARLAKPLVAMQSILAKREAGERTKISAEMIENVAEIAELIPNLNATGNAELEKFSQEIKSLISGLTKDDLSEDEKRRREVLKKVADISRRMTGRKA